MRDSFFRHALRFSSGVRFFSSGGQFKTESTLAQKFLYFSACLNVSEIPERAFEKLASQEAQNPYQEDWRNALGILKKHEVVSEMAKPKCIFVRPTVQKMTFEKFTDHEKIQWLTVTGNVLRQLYPYGKQEVQREHIDQKRALLPHLECLFAKWKEWIRLVDDPGKCAMFNIPIIDLINLLADAYGEFGDALKLKELLEYGLPLFEKQYGVEHPEVAIALVNLGLAHSLLGDEQKNLELLKRAIIIKERHYGNDHVEYAITLNNLGNAFSALEDFQRGRECLERALVIMEKHYGTSHPEVAITVENLGELYGWLGDLIKSQQFQLRALSIFEEHFGRWHPRVASVLIRLGFLYETFGERAKYEEVFKRALLIQEQHYGSDHPEVARTKDILKENAVSKRH